MITAKEIIFGFIGGLIAYFGLRNKHPKEARRMLIFGIIWAAIGIIIWYVIVPLIS